MCLLITQPRVEGLMAVSFDGQPSVPGHHADNQTQERAAAQ